jgi:hypothetical protein
LLPYWPRRAPTPTPSATTSPPLRSRSNADTNAIDPTDPSVAGGDAFDLADVGLTRARFVRVTDRPDLATVFDLDAVSIVHGTCE